MLYKQISQNKRNTVIIMVLFGILMLAISALFANFLTIWAGVIFFMIAIGYVLYTYFDATEHLMKVTGGVQLDKESAPEIYEMVEELCLAAGMPMPKLYVVPDSDPNAFATGRNPEHASLALTQGLLEIMNKQEVQGVIGHELSHIRNYDTRVTVIASAIVNLIYGTGMGLAIVAYGMITSKSKGIIALIIKLFCCLLGFIGLIIIVFGIPISKLLFLLVSRQREYLADVGSVDLTREPSGIISALQKLEDLENQDLLQSPDKNNLMLNSLSFNLPHVHSWWLRLMSDHPPLDKRIERLKNSDKV